MKSEDFFVSGFRIYVVATSAWATGGGHTLRIARTFFRHIFLAWRTDTACTHGSKCVQRACHISPTHLLPSCVSPTVSAVPARSPRHFVPVCTFLAELFPIRKRGSSAHPQKCRGVWLLGRSDALRTTECLGFDCGPDRGDQSEKEAPLARALDLFYKGLKEVVEDESEIHVSAVKFGWASLWEVLWLQNTLLKDKVLQEKDGISSRKLLQESVQSSVRLSLKPLFDSCETVVFGHSA